MRKGDFDGYDHFADHHFAYIDLFGGGYYGRGRWW
jgi:hypothetical protein